MSWIRVTPSLSDSSTREVCSVIVGLLLFVGVDQFLVQRLVGRFEILQTSLVLLCFLNQSCRVLMQSSVFLILLLRDVFGV